MSQDGGPDEDREPTHRASDDPFAPLFAEHTQLQVLAERMREVAGSLERGEAAAWADAAEGVEVHRRFLIDLHERREEIVGEALRGLGGPSVATALAACRTEHAASARFEEGVRAKLAAARTTEAARAVAGLFRKEADRFVDHHRSESERIYRPVGPSVPLEVRRALWSRYRSLDKNRGAAEARLSAWASKAHGSAD